MVELLNKLQLLHLEMWAKGHVSEVASFLLRVARLQEKMWNGLQ